jgi:geranylgeranyl diphosphate synthase type II
VARALADAAGHRELLAGQVLDLEAEGAAPDAARLEAIHRAKTGAMIRAALVCGGLAAGAAPTDVERLRRAGDALGLAFQIADDMLDITGGAELGKSRGKDAHAGKMTYPALHGLERSRALALEHAAGAEAEFAAWPTGAPLQQLARFCVERVS